MAASWYALATLFATALGASIAPIQNLVEKSTCGRVWVTVHSPEIKLNGADELLDAVELNWDFRGCARVPRQVGLFNGRPSSWNNALATYTIYSDVGFETTNIGLGEPELPAGWQTGVGSSGPSCLWPWVGAGDGDIQAYNCLKIQPTWMEDNADKINRMQIGDLVLAGTHNAGAFHFDTEVTQGGRDKFVLCQDRSIWAQLVHGIRYLDFRIAYYDIYDNFEDRYWLNHNLIRVRPLVPLLREIRTFLDNTKEVVFLDAHHFPIGFYEPDGSPIRSVHRGLIELIQKELGPHLALATQFATGTGTRGPTVQRLLNADKRLLLSYVDNTIVSENNWLWPNLPHLWANTNVVDTLFNFLDREIPQHPRPTARSPVFSAMAQTTPSVLDILFASGSLRHSADAVNRVVTDRLTNLWRYHANIVATDFFLGNDVVDTAIAISVEKSAL